LGLNFNAKKGKGFALFSGGIPCWGWKKAPQSLQVSPSGAFLLEKVGLRLSGHCYESLRSEIQV
jgi:hypothetical protein